MCIPNVTEYITSQKLLQVQQVSSTCDEFHVIFLSFQVQRICLDFEEYSSDEVGIAVSGLPLLDKEVFFLDFFVCQRKPFPLIFEQSILSGQMLTKRYNFYQNQNFQSFVR